MDLPVNEICFQQDTAERKRFFKAGSFAHPAKMVLGLQIYLIEHYTKPGDVILDPMAGSGTILIACTLGRNVILVELEEKFCDMMRGFDCDGKIKGYKDVWEEPIQAGWLVYCGMEAVEHLFETKKEAEKFYETWKFKGLPRDKGIRWRDAVEGHFIKVVIPAKCGKKKNHKPHFVEGNWQKIKSLGPMLGYKMGEAAILRGDARDLQGLLVDKIVTSPPYTNRMDGGTRGSDAGMHPYTDEPRDTSPKQRDQQNIGNLPYGKISAVISSPPYSDSNTTGRKDSYNGSFGPHSQVQLEDYRKTAGNIGNLPYKADAVITSPPYEEGGGHGGKPTKVAIEKRQSSMGQGTENLYSSNSENIGNLKSDNYLEAMLQVYRQCHRVLKDGGLLCLVTKNFIRDKKIVQLDLDTIKLCETAGFVLKERLKRKLTQQSFWRTIYYKKFPEVEKIEFEDVLIFAKSRPDGAI